MPSSILPPDAFCDQAGCPAAECVQCQRETQPYRIELTLEVEAVDADRARTDTSRILHFLNRAARGHTVITHAWIDRAIEVRS